MSPCKRMGMKHFEKVLISFLIFFTLLASSAAFASSTYQCRDLVVQTPVQDNPVIEFKLDTSLFGTLKQFEVDTTYPGFPKKTFKEYFQANLRAPSSYSPANDDNLVSRLELDPADVIYARSLTYQAIYVRGLLNYEDLYLSDTLISGEDCGMMIRVVDSHYGPIGSGPHLITEFYECQK